MEERWSPLALVSILTRVRTAPAERSSAMLTHVSSSMNHTPLNSIVEVAHSRNEAKLSILGYIKFKPRIRLLMIIKRRQFFVSH